MVLEKRESFMVPIVNNSNMTMFNKHYASIKHEKRTATRNALHIGFYLAAFVCQILTLS